MIKINDDIFVSGHDDGNLIIWKINFEFNEANSFGIKQVDQYQAYKKQIVSLS